MQKGKKQCKQSAQSTVDTNEICTVNPATCAAVTSPPATMLGKEKRDCCVNHGHRHKYVYANEIVSTFFTNLFGTADRKNILYRRYQPCTVVIKSSQHFGDV